MISIFDCYQDEDEAYREFKYIRWVGTDGEPVCPSCNCMSIYHCRNNKRFKCKECSKQFTVTSGTIFAGRKMPLSKILNAIEYFLMRDDGRNINCMELMRNLKCTYKTAYVLEKKIAEAMVKDHLWSPVSREWKGYWQRIKSDV